MYIYPETGADIRMSKRVCCLYRVSAKGQVGKTISHCIPDKSKSALREIEFLGLRGDAPVKEVTIHVGKAEIKVAVVNGLANARKLLKGIGEGKKFYHLIEVMTCQGGCIGGAGQPHGLRETKLERTEGPKNIDHSAMFKRAERNPVVVRMLGEMGEEKAHELLHVSYKK